VLAFWGVLKAGGVVVLINPLYMEKEIVHHMEDSGAKCLITLDLLWQKIDALRAKLPVKHYIVTRIDESLSFPYNWLYRIKARRAANAPAIDFSEDELVAWKTMMSGKRRFSCGRDACPETLALLQYTGGTTGLPKGVMLSHRNLSANAQQVAALLQQTEDTQHVFLSVLPFFHVYGLTSSLICPTALAATVLPLPRYVPHDVLKAIKKHKPTILPGAPSVYISLMQQKNLASYHLNSVKLCVSGSAPLPVEHFNRFQELTGARITEGYGLTEASPITHANPVFSDRQKPGSIGLPISGTDARIVDMEVGSVPLPPGKVGELIVRGPQVMKGYWNRPDETAGAIRNGWLYTGDIAMMDEEGYFYIVDRKKDMVIVAGYNVYPREIDEVLLEHPKILDAVAVGIADASRGECIKAYVVLKPGETMTRAEVFAWCRGKLAGYKVPRHVEFREDLPKTIVGKVLRRILRAEEDEIQAQENVVHFASRNVPLPVQDAENTPGIGNEDHGQVEVPERAAVPVQEDENSSLTPAFPEGYTPKDGNS
ncbi:MAG: long-chain fatty acid--CoA ligase, partial [Desulfovibrionaceae bacterium]|nr:long-chain fatty acid--CoA ligase [Desulfovibrionaceae bacterium]